jgi:hypothetical protein
MNRDVTDLTYGSHRLLAVCERFHNAAPLHLALLNLSLLKGVLLKGVLLKNALLKNALLKGAKGSVSPRKKPGRMGQGAKELAWWAGG